MQCQFSELLLEKYLNFRNCEWFFLSIWMFNMRKAPSHLKFFSSARAFCHSNSRTMCSTSAKHRFSWISIISNGFHDGYGWFSKFLGLEHGMTRHMSRTKCSRNTLILYHAQFHWNYLLHINQIKNSMWNLLLCIVIWHWLGIETITHCLSFNFIWFQEN